MCCSCDGERTRVRDMDIRPFKIDVSQEVLDDLWERLVRVRWPRNPRVGMGLWHEPRPHEGIGGLLTEHLRLAQGGGQTQSVPAVQGGRGRPWNPLHPCGGERPRSDAAVDATRVPVARGHAPSDHSHADRPCLLRRRFTGRLYRDCALSLWVLPV